MPERHPVQTVYRGKTCVGEWYVEDGQLHVTSACGSASGPVAMPGTLMIALPSELAAEMLWKLLRESDPKKPFFYWR